MGKPKGNRPDIEKLRTEIHHLQQEFIKINQAFQDIEKNNEKRVNKAIEDISNAVFTRIEKRVKEIKELRKKEVSLGFFKRLWKKVF